MTKKCTITVDDEVYCHLSGLEPQDFEFLFEKFSIMVEGAFFMPAYKMGKWSGKIPFVSKEGKVYSRLLDDIQPYLENWNYEIDIVDNRRVAATPVARVTQSWFLDKPDMKIKMELRPYQVEAVNTALEAGSGFIEAATSSGKCVDGKTPINIKCNKDFYDRIKNAEKTLD